MKSTSGGLRCRRPSDLEHNKNFSLSYTPCPESWCTMGRAREAPPLAGRATMIDKSRPGKGCRHTLPVFTPVRRSHRRHDGWTPERQRGFIEALADTGSVCAAAHAVNMAPEGAYQLRRHEEAHEFRQAWEAALALGVQRLEDVAMERALHGVEVPVYSDGKLVGTRRVYNDRLTMFLLRNRAGKRFAASGTRRPGCPGQPNLKKLKEQWHKEVFAKSLAESEALPARFAQAHTEFVHGMKPEALRYYKAFRLALGAQRRGFTLAEKGFDPLAPDFPIDDHLRLCDAGPPTDMREQMQEMYAGHDSAERYLKPPPNWRDEIDDADEDDED